MHANITYSSLYLLNIQSSKINIIRINVLIARVCETLQFKSLFVPLITSIQVRLCEQMFVQSIRSAYELLVKAY